MLTEYLPLLGGTEGLTFIPAELLRPQKCKKESNTPSFTLKPVGDKRSRISLHLPDDPLEMTPNLLTCTREKTSVVGSKGPITFPSLHSLEVRKDLPCGATACAFPSMVSTRHPAPLILLRRFPLAILCLHLGLSVPC